MILVIYCHQWILQELVNLILLAWTHRASAAWLIILNCRARSKVYRLSYTVSWKVSLGFSSVRQWMGWMCWSSWEFPALTWSWWSLLRSPALRGSCLPACTGQVHTGRHTDGRSWCRDPHRSSSEATLTVRGDLTRAMRRLSVRPLPLSPSPWLRDTPGADCPSSSPGGHCDGYSVLPSRYPLVVLLPTWLVTGQLGGQTDPATVSPPPEPPPDFLRTSLLVWTEAVVRGGLQALTRGTEPVTLTHTGLGFTRGLDWINIQVQEKRLRHWRGST